MAFEGFLLDTHFQLKWCAAQHIQYNGLVLKGLKTGNVQTSESEQRVCDYTRTSDNACTFS